MTRQIIYSIEYIQILYFCQLMRISKSYCNVPVVLSNTRNVSGRVTSRVMHVRRMPTRATC